MPSYPDYVKTTEDRAAYDKARKQKWLSWVHNASDILAIKEGCYFDVEAAERVERFFKLLKQSKGRWANQPLILQDWQRDQIIYPLFGWKRADGTRRYRKGLIFIPKKNGKSTLGAAISLYLLVADNESGAEVYNAAADKSNAMNVFGEAASMIRKSETLRKRLRIFDGIKRIRFQQTNSFYQVLSSDAASAEGKNIHGLVFDELHTQSSRDLWRALQGGGVSRTQPLFLAITTAGASTETLCYQEYEYAKGVINGSIPDSSYFAFVAEAGPNDDPSLPATWKKANPGLGVSPTVEALSDIYRKAKDSPEDMNDFRQYHLNQWVQAAKSAIPFEIWDRGGAPFDEQELIGKECWGGLDLGAVSDLTALALVFPWEDGTFRLLPKFWCPSDRAKDRDKKHVSYLKWIEDGFISATEGNITDWDVVRADINHLASIYSFRGIAVDTKFNGQQLCSDLQNKDNLPVVQYGNNEGSMCGPTKTMMELITGGKLHHNNNPVLRWMAGNTVFKKTGAQGNLWPDKAKSHQKIDGIVALVMALGLRQVSSADSGRSHYEDHDLLILGGDDDSGSPSRSKLENTDASEGLNETTQVRAPALKRFVRIQVPS